MNADRPITGTSIDEGDEIDLGQLAAMLWSGRWIITGATLITLLVGILYLIAANPVYQANGTVQVEQSSRGSMMGSELGGLFDVPTETQAEIQILQSRMVLNKVIDNLKLEILAQPRYFPLFGGFVARRRANDTNLAPPLFGESRYAWGGERIEVPQFDVPRFWIGATFRIIVLEQGRYVLQDPDGTELLRGAAGEQTTFNTDRGPVALFVRELRAHPGTQFELVRRERTNVLAALQKSVQVAEAGKQSGVIGITAEGPSPDYVAQVIQQMQDAYVRQNVERRSAEAQQSLEFLQEQLPDIRARGDAAQAKLNAYQLKQGSVNVTKETDLVLQQAVELETRRMELVSQRQQAIQRFTSQHPVVQTLDAQLRDLDQQQGSIKKRVETLPETQQEILSLMRDLEVNTQIYTTLLNSTQELQVAKAGTVGNVRIIDYPLVPLRKAKPRSSLVVAISILLGLVLGAGYLFLQRSLFRGVDRPDEVERVLGLATYAAIPYALTQRRLTQALRRKQAGSHILAEVAPDDVAIEALRSLRTSLQFALMEAPNNIVMFTGPTPALGKSFISVNLGAVLAKGGKKVVVVDCDMRRGHLHKYIGQTAAPGLSDFIAGNADMQSITRATPVADLRLITNGTTPPNPSELLLNERFGQLLNSLSQSYDLVIVDTPPVLPVTDAGIIGRLAGSVFIVLKEGAHPMRMVTETVRRLHQAGVQIRGTIFNQVGQRGGYGGYYNSYGYTYASKYSSETR